MKKIFKIKEKKEILIDENKNWLLKVDDRIYNVSKNSYSLYLLPLLEYEYKDLIKCIEKHGIINEFDKFFPLESLLKYPFQNEMKYWTQLSLIWLKQQSNIKAYYSWSKTVDQKWMSQELKHQFWKVFPKHQ